MTDEEPRLGGVRAAARMTSSATLEHGLTDADIEQHARLGIPLELLERAGVRRLSDQEARDRLSSRHHGDLSGLWYPYFDPLGDAIVTSRLRRDHPEIENGRPANKYLSAFGDRRHLYFARGSGHALTNLDALVVIVEAEKSVLAIAAAADRARRLVLPLATGGCWGFRGRRGKVEDASGTRVDEVGVLGDFDHVVWQERDVVILFDANAAANRNVQSARHALALELHRRGARVRIGSLPANDPTINGPDDLIAERGDDELWCMVDNAQPAHVNGRKFNGTVPVPGATTQPAPLVLTPVGALLQEADEAIDYVVAGRIPKGSVCGLCSKPKVGKTTFARALALQVARGGRFLGWPCAQGSVWYIDLENRRQDVRQHFRRLGATDDDPIFVFNGQAPQDIIEQLRAAAIQKHPALIIIDTLQRYLKAQDLDNYAEVTSKFEDVLGTARQSGAAILVLTHNSKSNERSGLDAILGSTAIAGSIDNAIILNRSARYRTVTTVQRTGVDLDETLIMLDAETGEVKLGMTREAADKDLVERQIVDALEGANDWLTKPELFDMVGARKQLMTAALNNLGPWGPSGEPLGTAGNQNVIRTGKGSKGDPYRYAVRHSNCGSRFPLKGGEPESSQLPFERSPNDSPGNSGSRLHTGVTEPPGTRIEPREPESASQEDDDAAHF